VNNIETEYKFKIEDVNKIKSYLTTMVAPTYERQYQKNVMFDNSQELMQKTNGRVRVRQLGDTGRKALTYKKPLSSKNGAKREVEHEIEFLDLHGNIENILKAMGFLPTSSYERYRTEWRINNVLVALDEYPFANFLEIEGKPQDIQAMAQKLKLDISLALTDPADTLFQKWRADVGLPGKACMRFADYDK
jgi:adenylate cyclase class 2